VLKKSGILLAALLLATFALAFSSAASAQTPQAPPAAQTVQPAAPLPSFLTAPAVQSPAVAPANGSNNLEWKASCTCTTDAVCVSRGMECCWWPNQTCGICC
jgi:hypothetical protein